MADATDFPPTCRCGIAARHGISQTIRNPGRAFWTCMKHSSDQTSCKFFVWEDTLPEPEDGTALPPQPTQQGLSSHAQSQPFDTESTSPSVQANYRGLRGNRTPQHPLTPPRSGSSAKRRRRLYRYSSPKSQGNKSDDESDDDDTSTDKFPAKRLRFSNTPDGAPSQFTSLGPSTNKGKARALSPVDSDDDSDEDDSPVDDRSTISDLLDMAGSFEVGITKLADSNRAKDRQIEALKKKVKELKLLLKIETLQAQLASKS